MSKRDFEAIAATVAASEAQGLIGSGARAALAGRFADYFERTYPSFKRELFIAACKGQGQVRP